MSCPLYMRLVSRSVSGGSWHILAHFGMIVNLLIVTIATGSCSCPGMVGVTIGAGVGRSSGVFGLIQDSLISARIVLADGRLIEVSENTHSDLFWGIRGAGANFGIITSATYRLHPQINGGQAVNLDFIFPLDTAPAYFDALESYNNSLPPELASVTVIMFNETSNSVRFQSQFTANFICRCPPSRKTDHN